MVGAYFTISPFPSRTSLKSALLPLKNCNFCKLCEAHEVEYHLAQTWEEISQRISIPFAQGIRVIEIPVNPEHSVQKRNDALAIQ